MIKTKICKVCNEEKEVTENFNTSRRYKTYKDGEKRIYEVPLTLCKVCQNKRSKDYYNTTKLDIKSDVRVLDTMIEIYKERNLNTIIEAFNIIGKENLKQLAYERLNK